MKRIVLLSALLLLAISAAAKPPQWVGTYGVPGYTDAGATALATDPADNVYAVGTAKGGGSEDLVVVKYSKGGVFQWADVDTASTADRGVDVALDGAGRIYVLGGGSGYRLIKYAASGGREWTVSDPLPRQPVEMVVAGNKIVIACQESSGGKTGKDITTVAYNFDGTPAWTMSYSRDTSASIEMPSGITADGAGNIYVTGTTEILAGTDTLLSDVVTIKYSPTGAQQWVQIYTEVPDPPMPYVARTDSSTDIGVMSDGSVVVCGVSAIPGLQHEILLIGYAADGTQLYVRGYSSPGNCQLGCQAYATELTTDNSLNSYIAGTLNNDPASPYTDMLVQKGDKNGILSWKRTVSGSAGRDDMALGIASWHSKFVYLTGVAYSADGSGDCLTAMYRQSGDAMWTDQWDGPDHMDDRANDVTVYDSNDVAIAGYTQTPAGKKLLVIKYEGTCCKGTRGNVDLGQAIPEVNLLDLSWLIAYLTIYPRPVLPCPEEANVNGIGLVDLSDLSFLIAYLTATPRPTLPPCP